MFISSEITQCLNTPDLKRQVFPLSCRGRPKLKPEETESCTGTRCDSCTSFEKNPLIWILKFLSRAETGRSHQPITAPLTAPHADVYDCSYACRRKQGANCTHVLLFNILLTQNVQVLRRNYKISTTFDLLICRWNTERRHMLVSNLTIIIDAGPNTTFSSDFSVTLFLYFCLHHKDQQQISSQDFLLGSLKNSAGLQTVIKVRLNCDEHFDCICSEVKG